MENNNIHQSKQSPELSVVMSPTQQRRVGQKISGDLLFGKWMCVCFYGWIICGIGLAVSLILNWRLTLSG